MRIPSMKVVFDKTGRKEILQHIDDCLRSGVLSQDKYVKQFEDSWSKYIGIKHAIAVNSGSSAIEISLRILGVEGKDVLVPVNTFAATAVSVLLAGGKVRFTDISPDTFSVSLESLKKRLTKRTAGVIIVHIGGIITPEITAIKRWCDANGLWLFEDCAHAHGSAFEGRCAGTFGIAGGYSFFATKIITSGEGGMIVTNNGDFSDKARLLRNHGKPQPWLSYHTHIGSNWRMGELNACVGLVHLKKLNVFIQWRKQIAMVYTALLKGIPGCKIILPLGESSWYKYILLLPKGMNRDKLKTSMKKKGVSLSGEVYEIPLHRQPIFRKHSKESFPIAEDICLRHICLPLFYGMTDKQARFVVEALKNEI